MRAAELYYDDNKTQDEVGALLKISRFKVGRLLTQARERGIVRIEIVHPRARRLGLERELRERFGLADAVVVPTPDGDPEATRPGRPGRRRLPDRPAPGAAHPRRELGSHPQRGRRATRAGLDDRRDSRAGQRGRQPHEPRGHGGGDGRRRSPSAAAARRSCCRAPPSSSGPRPSARSKPTALSPTCCAAHPAADAYLYSAGVADESSVLVESGYLGADDVAELVRKGAVGDVVGRYIDADGQHRRPLARRAYGGTGTRRAARRQDRDLRRGGHGQARRRTSRRHERAVHGHRDRREHGPGTAGGEPLEDK